MGSQDLSDPAKTLRISKNFKACRPRPSGNYHDILRHSATASLEGRGVTADLHPAGAPSKRKGSIEPNDIRNKL